MNRTLILALTILIFTSWALAQDDHHKIEIYGGYSHNFVDCCISTQATVTISSITGTAPTTSVSRFNERRRFKGFNAAVTYNFSKYIGATFDASGYYGIGTGALYGGFFPDSSGSGVIGSIPSISGGFVPHRYYNYMGGVQIKNNSTKKRFKPFVRALLGISRQSATYDGRIYDTNLAIYNQDGGNKLRASGLSMAFGGGLDIRISKRIDIRVVQFDYNPVFLKKKTLISAGDKRTLQNVVTLQSPVRVPSSTYTSLQTVSIGGYRQDTFRIGFGVIFH